MKDKIKAYWNNKQPSLWYSNKTYGSKEYYDLVDSVMSAKLAHLIKNKHHINHEFSFFLSKY